jgi:hypothetical protein
MKPSKVDRERLLTGILEKVAKGEKPALSD